MYTINQVATQPRYLLLFFFNHCVNDLIIIKTLVQQNNKTVKTTLRMARS